MRTARRLGLLVMLAAVATISADLPSRGSDIGYTQVVTGGTALPNFPLDEYRVSVVEAWTLRRATASAANDCLATYGLGRILDEKAARPLDFNDRRYGPIDLATAQGFGYHLTTRQATTEPPQQFSASEQVVLAGRESSALLTGEARLDVGVDKSVNGVPLLPNGCFGQAQSAVDPSGAVAESQIVELLGAQIFEDSMTSPAVLSAFADWSQCMAARGHTFSDPLAAAERADLSTAEPSAAERALAVADVECKQQTNLVNRWSTVEITLQNAALQASRSELAPIRPQIEESLRRAADVLEK